MNAFARLTRDVTDRTPTKPVGEIIHEARRLVYSNVHLDESQWPSLCEDARQLNLLAADLDSFGYEYYARTVIEDGSFYVEIINDDEDSVNYSNLYATCWLDEHGHFYYEA